MNPARRQEAPARGYEPRPKAPVPQAVAEFIPQQPQPHPQPQPWGNAALAAHAAARAPGAAEPLPSAQARVGNAAVVQRLAPADSALAPASTPAAGQAAPAGSSVSPRGSPLGSPFAAPSGGPVQPAAKPGPAANTAKASPQAEGAQPGQTAKQGDTASSAEGKAAGAPRRAAAAAAPRGKVVAAEPGDSLLNLASLPASGMARGLANARRSSAAGFNELHDELANTPPTLDRPSGLPRKPALDEEAEPAAEAIEPAPREEPPPGEQPLPEEEPASTPFPLPASLIDVGELDSVPEDEPQNFMFAASQMLRSIPETDETVDTSAGERPTVKMDKDADPAVMAQDTARQRECADTAWVGAREGMTEYEGEDDIFPTVPEEKLTANFGSTKLPVAGQRLGAAVLDQPEVAAAVDGAAGSGWAEQMAQAQADNAAAVQTKETNERAKRDATATEIAQAEQDAADEQTGQQAQAKDDVAAARKAWNDELAAGDQTYTNKAKTLRDDHQTQIDKAEQDANSQAKKSLEKAETDAAAEKKEKVAEAEAKKREAEEESDGFWGWVKSKAKALINAIRSAINAIFNALRRVVKFIIDQAKKLAVWFIEQARKVIVGLIRAFGKALELAADVFLCMFPKARDKAKSLIRRGVNSAENAVNAAADALKKRVCELLDALGAALDFILELYQKAYNAILDVVEFFVVGLIEIIEGIVRLGESASMVGDHFVGQVEEEGLGVDLTQPLPIEKPEGDGEADIGTASQRAVETGAISSSDAALLSRSSLTNSDAVADPVAEMSLDPALLASVLPQASSGEYHFGQNEAPENQRNAILQGALSSQTGAAEPTAEGPAAPAVAGASPAAGSNPAQMTPEEQLTYLEGQEVPHTCNEKKSEEPAGSDTLPAHMRIYGRFTPSQRFRYMWGQIKKGISQWWSCNWGKVIAVFAVGALIALLLGILTGGAIFAAIPPLLEIVGTLLVGVALARAASYIGDYLSLAWKGDLAGGAKALARAFALLIIELIFALLFNAGAVIKALKSGLKGTVKAATGAVKGAIKGTVKAAGELGHAGVAIFKAGVKNSKLIIAGFRNGFGQGVRTIGQLTRELLSKVHFRGFYFRLKGRVLELWGRFNADVLLGRQKITLEDAEKAFKAIAQSGEKLAPAARTEAENLAKTLTKMIAEDGAELSKTLRSRVRRFFNKFKSQHLEENPVLAEVWNRAVGRLENGQYAKYFKNGELIDNVPAEAMKKMYAAARGNTNEALEEVLLELEQGFGKQLTNRVSKLPENVQIHHLLYKSIEPELALAHSNLVLALRKTGGSADELHDLFHLISAAGQGNRWRTLNEEIGDIIRDMYKL